MSSKIYELLSARLDPSAPIGARTFHRHDMWVVAKRLGLKQRWSTSTTKGLERFLTEKAQEMKAREDEIESQTARVNALLAEQAKRSEEELASREDTYLYEEDSHVPHTSAHDAAIVHTPKVIEEHDEEPEERPLYTEADELGEANDDDEAYENNAKYAGVPKLNLTRRDYRRYREMLEPRHIIRPSGLVIDEYTKGAPFMPADIAHHIKMNPRARYTVRVRNQEGQIWWESANRYFGNYENARGFWVKMSDGNREYEFLTVSAWYFPERGGCDAHHERIKYFTLGNGKKITVMEHSSKNNNCAVAICAYVANDKRKHKVIVGDLGLSNGMKTDKDLDKLSWHYKQYIRVFGIDGRKKKSFGEKMWIGVDILHHSEHYMHIISGVRTHGAMQYITREAELLKQKMKKTEQCMDVIETIYDDGNDDFGPLAKMIAESNDSFLIDGAAGTGKSHLSMMIASILKDKIAMTASTGIAAARIGGMTTMLFERKYKFGKKNQYSALLIDEVGMISGIQMERYAEQALRKQMRMILVGDLYQLLSVNANTEGMFFQSDVLKLTKFKRVLLTKVRRTDNVEYAELCNRFRIGKPTDEDIEFMESKYIKNPNREEYPIVIESTNERVDKWNADRFIHKGEGEAHNYNAIYIDVFPDEREVQFHGVELAKENLYKMLKARIITKMNKHNVSFKVGHRVMAIANQGERGDDARVFYRNGMLGTVKELFDDSVCVMFDDGHEETIGMISNVHESERKNLAGKFEYKYMPLKLAYAFTVHKSQSATFDCKVLFSADKCFASGQYYTAITRVSDPKLLTITGKQTPDRKDYKPNKIIRDFMAGEPIHSVADIIAEQENESTGQYHYGKGGEPIDATERESDEPSEALMFDFETAESAAGEHRPYAATWTLVDDKFDEKNKGVITDIVGMAEAIPGIEYSDDVAKSVMKMINEMKDRFVEKLKFIIAISKTKGEESRISKKTKGEASGKNSKKATTIATPEIRKWAKEHCPRVCAYNGASFDFYFIANKMLNENESNYRPQFIFKGCALVGFSLIDTSSLCCVLKFHDLCQMMMCSLKDACGSMLPKDDPSNNKIDFHNEIIYLAQNRYKNMNTWKWDDWKNNEISLDVDVAPSQYHNSPYRFMKKTVKTFKPSDVLEYAIRDTDVLVKLYKAFDQIVRKITDGLSIWSFLTIASLTWYCGMQHAITMIGEPIKKDIKSHSKRRNKGVDLFGCDLTQDKFVRAAIYGGRACPRIIYSSQEDGCAEASHVYLDVKAMYGSILLKSILPCGDINWIRPECQQSHLEVIRKFADECKADRGLHSLTFENLPEFFIVECEYQENTNSLEPVLSAKNENGTFYTVNRRTAVMTSLDMAMILIKGGNIFESTRMLHFSRGAKWTSDWAGICMEGKDKFAGTAMGTVYKLMLNAFYGSMLRKDHVDEYKIVSRPEETESFLRKYDWKFAISTSGQYDIMYGTPKDCQDEFSTSRPGYAGAFVLAYSRMMVQQIVQIANPNEDPRLQPVVGDTDSLLVPYEGAMRLRAAGWFPDGGAKPGQLTDELKDTILDKIVPTLVTGRNLVEASVIPREKLSEKQMEMSCAKLISVVSDDDVKLIKAYLKKPYANKDVIVSRWVSPAPKMLAVEFKDPVSGIDYYKFRSKGISLNSEVGEVDGVSQLMSAGILFDWNKETFIPKMEHGLNGAGVSAKLPSGLRKIGPSNVKRDDRQESKSLLTIRGSNMIRNILSRRWEGRAYIGNGITVPHGHVLTNPIQENALGKYNVTDESLNPEIETYVFPNDRDSPSVKSFRYLKYEASHPAHECMERNVTLDGSQVVLRSDSSSGDNRFIVCSTHYDVWKIVNSNRDVCYHEILDPRQPRKFTIDADLHERKNGEKDDDILDEIMNAVRKEVKGAQFTIFSSSNEHRFSYHLVSDIHCVDARAARELADDVLERLEPESSAYKAIDKMMYNDWKSLRVYSCAKPAEKDPSRIKRLTQYIKGDEIMSRALLVGIYRANTLADTRKHSAAPITFKLSDEEQLLANQAAEILNRDGCIVRADANYRGRIRFRRMRQLRSFLCPVCKDSHNDQSTLYVDIKKRVIGCWHMKNHKGAQIITL